MIRRIESIKRRMDKLGNIILFNANGYECDKLATKFNELGEIKDELKKKLKIIIDNDL